MKKHNIELQAYHGRSFVGNHCVKYLKKEVRHDLSKSVYAMTRQNTDCSLILSKATRVAAHFNKINKLYESVHKKNSHSEVITETEFDDLKLSIVEYMAFYRKCFGNDKVFPKLHF